MKLHHALFLIATSAGFTCASGQNLINPAAPASAPTPAASACPAAQAIGPQQLYGLWQVQISGQPGSASLYLEKDPEQPDSLVGSISRASRLAQIAGEIEQGNLSLEESDDGTRISATWAGQVSEGSCGKEIKGLWTNTLLDNATPQAFVLRKPTGAS
jgi:hypothetical protein